MRLDKKLVGDDDERAVSPVIGVILMVAITVILAAVIAAFVLDLGDSVSQEAQAGVDVDSSQTGDGNLTVSVTSMGNSERIELRGDTDDLENNGEGDHPLTSAGDSFTMSPTNEGPEGLLSNSGTVRIVAITEDGSETVIQSYDYNFD